MAKSTTPNKAAAVRQRGVTMNDVAKHAGVSRTAVSFVLSNRENTSISEETRIRINEAVQELGYRPNAGARALASQRSDWYGIVTEIVTAPFAVDIIKGAQDEAWLDRRFLLIAPSDQADAAGPNQGMEDAAVEKLLEQRVEGLLYAATYHRGVHVPDSANEVPTVLINCFDMDGKLPSIVPDERAGGRVAVERLLQAGHTRIGVINLDPDIPAAVGRLEGAREALADAGLELDPELVVAGHATADGGYEAACRNPGPLPGKGQANRTVLPQRPHGDGRIRRHQGTGPDHPRRHRRDRLRQPGTDCGLPQAQADHGCVAVRKNGRPGSPDARRSYSRTADQLPTSNWSTVRC